MLWKRVVLQTGSDLFYQLEACSPYDGIAPATPHERELYMALDGNVVDTQRVGRRCAILLGCTCLEDPSVLCP
jgi:hypothetical protein